MSFLIPKISIIVPVYNAGGYLVKCLDSLVNQTLREIEIVLVLDCPTDGSDNTAKEYAAKDKRIVVLENETNLHIGASRNRGLRIARGEYVGFSDHDDYMELDMYEKLYRKGTETDADIVLGRFMGVGLREEENIYPDIEKSAFREFLITDLLQNGNDDTFTPYAVNILPNLYKNEFIQKHDIRFLDTKIFTSEDWAFQIMSLYFADKIELEQDAVYYHTAHEQNTGESFEYCQCRLNIKTKEAVLFFLEKQGSYKENKHSFLKGVKKTLTDSLLSELFYTRSLSGFLATVKYAKTFPFVKEAFAATSYSLSRYRFFGKLNRKLLFFFMKL